MIKILKIIRYRYIFKIIIEQFINVQLFAINYILKKKKNVKKNT